MKNILLLLSLLYAGAAHAISLPAASAVVGINGQTTETVANMMSVIPLSALPNASIYTLCGGRSGASTGATYFGLYNTNSPTPGQTQYQIPVNKTLYGISASFMSSVETTWVPVTSTQTNPGDNTTTAPLSAIYYGSIGQAGNSGAGPFTTISVNVVKSMSAVGVNFYGGNTGNGLYVSVWQNAAGHNYFCFTGYLQ